MPVNYHLIDMQSTITSKENVPAMGYFFYFGI